MNYNFILIYIILLFSCNKNTIFDIDGNKYTFIKIGSNYWMQQNLKSNHFQNGDPIIYLENDSLWLDDKVGAFCYYNNEVNNKEIYGNLYNWFAINDKRNICPKGWQVASRQDYYELSSLFGYDTKSAQHLKFNGDSLWLKSDTKMTNSSGFYGVPSGHRTDQKITFERLGEYAFYWTIDEYLGENCSINYFCAYECSLRSYDSYFNQDWGHKNRGMSVRCVKKAPNRTYK